uniref:Integrin alpha-2 domain-containing protein n=1 Tax=Chromera velia CCMP2878 TaxID=1169474 RepID=A0A0G4HY46_9ALVE|eukprot:Cvel_33432.t1-p1 / transcript=Cvel_33432.t1 / gene=Cvel_33432 / organism=Chromera_velia_CCMP2878 / gene_product=Integrin alpha-1, putative / transcript_product=Integrin alpha-1, putative / location=Cvel_scaffold5428:120-3466(+) / protein_length=509 / sequence_SO=supercontig / SO=protein_coding / is_pseudo=false
MLVSAIMGSALCVVVHCLSSFEVIGHIAVYRSMTRSNVSLPSFADPDGDTSKGSTYLIYGRNTTVSGVSWEDEIDTEGWDIDHGCAFKGVDASDFSGGSVASAGDVNKDGLAEIIIGASSADPGGRTSAGEAYVIFGTSADRTSYCGVQATFDLSSLDGSNGFVLNGVANTDRAGVVASAGDVNNDGVDDVLVGAGSASPNSRQAGGEVYVFFGKDTSILGAFDTSYELSNLDGSNGFTVQEVNRFCGLGLSLTPAGDINGDGIADIILGAETSDDGSDANSNKGAAYVIFGSNGAFASTLLVSALDGSNGFSIPGAARLDQAGTAVSSAGDINGDGVDDIAVGAPEADPDGRASAGETYVIFGKRTATAGAFDAVFDVTTFDGSNGFTVKGEKLNNKIGGSLSGGVDVNGDGLADLLIGGQGAASGDGTAYVIYGKNTATAGEFAASIDLLTLSKSDGVKILRGSDQTGSSVAALGDIDGDGVGDLVVGANFAHSFLGKAFVVFSEGE